MATKLQPLDQPRRLKKRISTVPPTSFPSQSVIAKSLLLDFAEQENSAFPAPSPPPTPFYPAPDTPVPPIMEDAVEQDAVDSLISSESSVVTTSTPNFVTAAAGESSGHETPAVKTAVTSDANITAALLGEALSKVWESSDLNLRTKKIVDAVLRLEIEAVEGNKVMPDVHAPAADYRVVVLCVVMWMIVLLLVSARGFVGWDSAVDMPPPT